MANITYDEKSFILDNRRLWLVSGAIHYPRVPEALWRQRIRAAKQAGLNCIETYVFWNVHEPRPGRFDFTGNLDLRRFVQTVGEEGMYCILRPGPYVCAEWDFGGLPAWLHRTEGVKLREANGPFLQACARYFGAVMEQVRDLQVTMPGEPSEAKAGAGNVPGDAAGGFAPGSGGGPILLIQVENEWFCHHEQQAHDYLRELVRYLRENGCTVPLVNCNNLWQRVEGTIDAWNGSSRLLANMRQLGVVQPDAPRLVTEYWAGWFDTWNQPRNAKEATPAGRRAKAEQHLYRMAQILAGGGQYNLYMFHGGTNFGFHGGRTVGGPDRFMTTSYDYDAPLLEAGGRGEKYLATKRLSTFASQFHFVLAHCDMHDAPAVLAPSEDGHPSQGVTVIHHRGDQGEVVFLLREAGDKNDEPRVLLSSGLTLPVPMGDDRAAWLLLNTNLQGVAHLDYTNLRPWALLQKRMLVLFGPAGAEGLLSIDDVPVQIRVPTGKKPTIEQHDPLTVVVLNDAQLDAAYLTGDGLAIGCAGLDEAGEPLPLAGWPTMLRVDVEGNVSESRRSVAKAPAAPRLGRWQFAGVDDLLDGSSEAYQKITGPTSLEKLGCDFGYGWYRLRLGKAGGRAKVLAPLAGDRLHLYHKGKRVALLGVGPGAVDEPMELTLGGEVVVLADNLGRFNYGLRVGEEKGLFGHLYAVKTQALPKPKIIADRSPDPFVLRGYVPGARHGDKRASESLIWKLRPAARKPMILQLDRLPQPAMIFINGQPLAYYEPELCAGRMRYVLEVGEQGFTGGVNELKLALFTTLDRAIKLKEHVTLYQTTRTITQRAEWSFTPWTPEAPEEGKEDSPWQAVPQKMPARPAWYRVAFNVKEATVPLWFEPRGLSKGQLFLNGHNVGRYFVATAEGKAVPPQSQYYLPEPWLRTDAPNELMIFEEHGKRPDRCRLVYNPMGPFG